MALALGENSYTVRLKRPHAAQVRFLRSQASRRIICAGRRSGKTTGLAIATVEAFLAGKRVLYAAPVAEQINRWWKEVCAALYEPIEAGIFKKNETEKTIELVRTEQRIKGKTAWSADTLRGDFADLLILDEFSLMNEDAFSVVGLPMLLDRNGMCYLCFTPPSFRTAGTSKAHDPRHAAKLFMQAKGDTSGRWAAFHHTSYDNPHISRQALTEISQDMTTLAVRQELQAELLDEIPGALFTLRLLDATRVTRLPELTKIVVGIDPGHDAGIVVAGLGEDDHGYVLEDLSITGDPDTWARQAIAGYHKYHADALIPERNHGGDMVETTIRHTDPRVNMRTVWASHGKYARGEPVSALYAQGKIHHCGVFPDLEDEMCSWLPLPGHPSPNRMDSLVWALTDLMLGEEPKRARAWGRD